MVDEGDFVALTHSELTVSLVGEETEQWQGVITAGRQKRGGKMQNMGKDPSVSTGEDMKKETIEKARM